MRGGSSEENRSRLEDLGRKWAPPGQELVWERISGSRTVKERIKLIRSWNEASGGGTETHARHSRGSQLRAANHAGTMGFLALVLMPAEDPGL